MAGWREAILGRLHGVGSFGLQFVCFPTASALLPSQRT